MNIKILIVIICFFSLQSYDYSKPFTEYCNQKILDQINIKSYLYPKPFSGYYSQKGQDKFLNEEIFKNKEKGVFVDIGAHDGLSFSNTYFFEKNRNWRGVCVEPNPDIFEILTKNRNCYCKQVCIADSIGVKQFLKCSGYILEMYSGLLENIDPRHLDRINQEIALYSGNKEIICVECLTLQKLFDEFDLEEIDLLTIDIEGGEKAAISTIDFDKIHINIICIENNFDENEIRDFLNSKGFKLISRIGKDDIFQNERNLDE